MAYLADGQPKGTQVFVRYIDAEGATTSPAYGGTFQYGRPLKQHGWQPMSNADLIREMADRSAGMRPSARHDLAVLIVDRAGTMILQQSRSGIARSLCGA